MRVQERSALDGVWRRSSPQFNHQRSEEACSRKKEEGTVSHFARRPGISVCGDGMTPDWLEPEMDKFCQHILLHHA